MNYFAYGSNMLTCRLIDRVGSVKKGKRAMLKGYSLIFNKMGKNGSGKANVQIGDDMVEGVLFELTTEQFNKLDKSEGVKTGDYFRTSLQVLSNKILISSEVYIACPEKIRENLKPKCCYLQYLKDGAEEYELSSRCKKLLASFECQ